MNQVLSNQKIIRSCKNTQGGGSSGVRNIIQETDDVFRTFTGTYAVGKTWSTHSFSANSKLNLSYYIPARNNQANSSVGLKIEYSIDGGAWVLLGESGKYSSVTTAAGLAEAGQNNYLFDPAMGTDFDIQFRFLHKAMVFTNTAYVNQDLDQVGDMFKTHFKIEEIKAS